MSFALPLLGGALIGAAAFLLFWMNGRICGISGIAGGILGARHGDALWRITFLAGLVAGGGLFALLSPASTQFTLTTSTARLALGGLLVGYGARLGAGCTSGHGVCGVARGSARSWLATAVFLTAGMATVYVTHHMMGGAR